MAVSTPIRRVILTAKESKRKISQGRDAIESIGKVIEKRTRVKREAFAQTNLFRKRREENEKRQTLEDELEAPRVIKTPTGPQQLVQATGTRGFFDRILGFIGYLAAGWIMNNLPTWIAMGKEFVARLQKAGEIVSGFFNNTIELFKNVGNILGGLEKNLMQFDFFDTSNRVKNSMSELNTTLEKLTGQIEEAYELLTTPLTEGKYSGEDIPEVGTQYEDEGAYTEPGSFESSMTATGGEKATPYIYSGFRTASRPKHNGIDISGGPWQSGAPISIIKPGVVVQAEDLGKTGWGKYVVIKHNDGTYSLYGHLSQINVRKGEQIENKTGAAKVIGKVGSTGKSEGPHLHFELGTGWNGGTLTGHMNPTGYIDSYTRVGGNVKTTATTASTPQQTLMGQPTSKAGKKFSLQELVALAKQAGFKGDNAAIAAAVAYAESTGNSMSHNKKRPDNSYGLWQINMIDGLGPDRRKRFGLRSNEDLFDPLTNAKVAYKMSGGSNFNAWTTFNPRDKSTPKYLTFLPEARKSSGISPSQYTQARVPSQSETPAQIAAPAQQTNTVPFSFTPERTGQDIIIIDQPRQQQNIITSASGGGGQGPSAISDFDLLNNFIKNKLLLDLAYV